MNEYNESRLNCMNEVVWLPKKDGCWMNQACLNEWWLTGYEWNAARQDNQPIINSFTNLTEQFHAVISIKFGFLKLMKWSLIDCR